MERESFIFYRSFFDNISKLPTAEEKAEAYEAIAAYGLYGEEPGELSLGADLIYGMAKPQMDANIKRASDGAKGGRPKTTGLQKEKPLVSESKNHRLRNEKPNVNDNDNVNANVNENENEKGIVKGKREQAKEETTPAPTDKDPEVEFTFGEFRNVVMTDTQHKRLVEKYGVRATDQYIEKLSSYMESTGKKYKSHYAVITGWMNKDAVPEQNAPTKAGSDLMARAMKQLGVSA